MAHINIKYIEPNPDQYECVVIWFGKDQKKSFNSGNFIKDWYDMRKFMIREMEDNSEYHTQSSTVDNFIMDGAPFDRAYLHIIDGKGVLKYLDRTQKNWYFDTDGITNGIEFYVLEGTQPTWDELREICGDFNSIN